MGTVQPPRGRGAPCSRSHSLACWPTRQRLSHLTTIRWPSSSPGRSRRATNCSPRRNAPATEWSALRLPMTWELCGVCRPGMEPQVIVQNELPVQPVTPAPTDPVAEFVVWAEAQGYPQLVAPACYASEQFLLWLRHRHLRTDRRSCATRQLDHDLRPRGHRLERHWTRGDQLRGGGPAPSPPIRPRRAGCGDPPNNLGR